METNENDIWGYFNEIQSLKGLLTISLKNYINDANDEYSTNVTINNCARKYIAEYAFANINNDYLGQVIEDLDNVYGIDVTKAKTIKNDFDSKLYLSQKLIVENWNILMKKEKAFWDKTFTEIN